MFVCVPCVYAHCVILECLCFYNGNGSLGFDNVGIQTTSELSQLDYSVFTPILRAVFYSDVTYVE